jgi:hypothetical protein
MEIEKPMKKAAIIRPSLPRAQFSQPPFTGSKKTADLGCETVEPFLTILESINYG